jgi:hypothetical protein
MMKNKIGVAIEQTFPRSSDRFKMQVKPGAGTIVEKPAQQRERLRQRAKVANDHPQFTFLAHRELRRVILEHPEIMQKNARALMK